MQNHNRKTLFMIWIERDNGNVIDLGWKVKNNANTNKTGDKKEKQMVSSVVFISLRNSQRMSRVISVSLCATLEKGRIIWLSEFPIVFESLGKIRIA